ncbi:hypothetical protein D3C83_296030 [compost metagenome]
MQQRRVMRPHGSRADQLWILAQQSRERRHIAAHNRIRRGLELRRRGFRTCKFPAKLLQLFVVRKELLS